MNKEVCLYSSVFTSLDIPRKPITINPKLCSPWGIPWCWFVKRPSLFPNWRFRVLSLGIDGSVWPYNVWKGHLKVLISGIRLIFIYNLPLWVNQSVTDLHHFWQMQCKFNFAFLLVYSPECVICPCQKNKLGQRVREKRMRWQTHSLLSVWWCVSCLDAFIYEPNRMLESIN